MPGSGLVRTWRDCLGTPGAVSSGSCDSGGRKGRLLIGRRVDRFLTPISLHAEVSLGKIANLEFPPMCPLEFEHV